MNRGMISIPAKLQVKQAHLGETRIEAPWDGVMGTSAIQLGEVLAPNTPWGRCMIFRHSRCGVAYRAVGIWLCRLPSLLRYHILCSAPARCRLRHHFLMHGPEFLPMLFVRLLRSAVVCGQCRAEVTCSHSFGPLQVLLTHFRFRRSPEMLFEIVGRDWC